MGDAACNDHHREERPVFSHVLDASRRCWKGPDDCAATLSSRRQLVCNPALTLITCDSETLKQQRDTEHDRNQAEHRLTDNNRHRSNLGPTPHGAGSQPVSVCACSGDKNFFQALRVSGHGTQARDIAPPAVRIVQVCAAHAAAVYRFSASR